MRCLVEFAAHFIAKMRKEREFKTFASRSRYLAQIRFCYTHRLFIVWFRFDVEAEAAQNPFKREGKFPDGNRMASEFMFEIMQDGGGGVVDQFRVEKRKGVAHQFNGAQINGARDFVSIRCLENQII